MRPEALALARGLGASHTLDAGRENVPGDVLDLTEDGVDWAFEVLGRPSTIEQAWELIGPGRMAVVVGLPPKGSRVTLSAVAFIAKKGILGCFYGSSSMRRDLPLLLEWLRDGKLQIDPLVTRTLPLERIEDAFPHLREGSGMRTVLSFAD